MGESTNFAKMAYFAKPFSEDAQGTWPDDQASPTAMLFW